MDVTQAPPKVAAPNAEVTTPSHDSRPNIVIILADDMGFSDLGCYGSEVRTPAIDALGARGLRFSQMYNSARCCPSRAALLTGLHPHQAGIGHMVIPPPMWVPHTQGDAISDFLPTPEGYGGYLSDNCVTIAEVLKDVGYRTILSGKWHASRSQFLPGEISPERTPPRTHPNDRGFEEFFGITSGGGSYFNPPDLVHNRDDSSAEDPDFYLTDAITDHAIDHVGRALDQGSPFFLYLSFTAPHWPLHALEEDIATYERQYRGGWDQTRAERHERLRAEGIIDQSWPISARDPQAWPWAESAFPDWEAHRMAVYAAQIDRMDQNVGRLIHALRQRQALDNTLIMVLSDNGGCAEFLAEEGVLDLTPMAGTMPDGRPIRFGNDAAILPGGPDTFASYDVCWSNVSNAPFRRHKRWVHEGGISTPLVVHWPERIHAPAIVHIPAHIIDVLPTCLEVAGVRYPTEFMGHHIHPVEGVSLTPTFDNPTWTRPGGLYFEHEGNRALRDGPWKLVSAWPGRWELFNVETDRTETIDRAANEPARVRRLAAEWGDWARRVGVDLEFRERFEDLFAADVVLTGGTREKRLRNPPTQESAGS